MVREWTGADDQLTVNTRESCLIEPGHGWSRRYLLFLSDNFDETVHFTLMPYNSIITDEQVGQATDVIRGEKPKYDSLRLRLTELRQQTLQAPAADVGKLDEAWNQLEQDTRQLNEQTRVLVKQLFSEQQMEQHELDRDAGRAHLKPEDQ